MLIECPVDKAMCVKAWTTKWCKNGFMIMINIYFDHILRVLWAILSCEVDVFTKKQVIILNFEWIVFFLETTSNFLWNEDQIGINFPKYHSYWLLISKLMQRYYQMIFCDEACSHFSHTCLSFLRLWSLAPSPPSDFRCQTGKEQINRDSTFKVSWIYGAVLIVSNWIVTNRICKRLVEMLVDTS